MKASAPILLALALSAAASARGGGQAPARTYRVDPAASAVTIQVGKSGAFSFAGHEHEVAAPGLTGEVVAEPQDLARSSVSLTFDAASLRVTGRREPARDVPKVQAAMEEKVTEPAKFPEIRFRSRQVSGRRLDGGSFELQVTGDLTLHGVTRALTLPVRVDLAGDVLTASGKARIRHTDFGLQRISAGGGTVKVKNEIDVDYRIVARAAP